MEDSNKPKETDIRDVPLIPVEQKIVQELKALSGIIGRNTKRTYPSGSSAGEIMSMLGMGRGGQKKVNRKCRDAKKKAKRKAAKAARAKNRRY